VTALGGHARSDRSSSFRAAPPGALVVLFLSFAWGAPARAQEEKPAFNPADPTAAASHIEVMPEYNQGDDYSARSCASSTTSTGARGSTR